MRLIDFPPSPNSSSNSPQFLIEFLESESRWLHWRNSLHLRRISVSVRFDPFPVVISVVSTRPSLPFCRFKVDWIYIIVFRVLSISFAIDCGYWSRNQICNCQFSPRLGAGCFALLFGFLVAFIEVNQGSIELNLFYSKWWPLATNSIKAVADYNWHSENQKWFVIGDLMIDFFVCQVNWPGSALPWFLDSVSF